MDDTEAKVRCLEMAERISGRAGDKNTQVIADTATRLYTWVKSEGAEEKPKRRGRPRKEENPLD